MDKTFERAFASVRDAVEAGRIPGAVLGLLNKDGKRHVASVGHAQLVPDKRPLDAATWFDLASLTKVIFTTSAILDCVKAGKIALDDRLTSVIPDFRQYDATCADRQLTFRQLLSHNTNLPAVEPLYSYGLDALTMRAFILQRDWKAGPPVYSDINFLLLGIALERIHGKRLSEFALPDGLSFAPPRDQTAATEFCTWRNRIICGEVHDENAFAFGGAAGHAGLFGTVNGVLDFAAGLLSRTRFDAAGLQAIRTRQHANRTVGWEIAHDNWTGGATCSPTTIGHTGFTGTGLWVDFDKGVSWTLLTNRVHPSRHTDTGIMALRREVGTILAA